MVGGMLAAIAVALLWSRDFMLLERHYLAGRFDRLRKKLSFWSASLGPAETLMLRVAAAVESRDNHELSRCYAAAKPLGFEEYARAWAVGAGNRLAGDIAGAITAFTAGARKTGGLECAELLLMAQLTRLQTLYEYPFDQRAEAINQVLRLLNQADNILRDPAIRRVDRIRSQYVEVLRHGLRGLICLLQGRSTEGRRKLNEVIRRARLIRSVRARWLAQLFEIERLMVVHSSLGKEAFRVELFGLKDKLDLPSLQQRAKELEAWCNKDPQELRAATVSRKPLLSTMTDAKGKSSNPAAMLPMEEKEEDDFSALPLFGESKENGEDDVPIKLSLGPEPSL